MPSGKKISLLFLFLLICICSSMAQYAFKDKSSGISHNTINGIVEDRFGFIWVSTEYGLNRFDGTSYTSFLHDHTHEESIPSSFINSMQYDGRDHIYLASSGGLTIISIKDFKIQTVDTSNSVLHSNAISSIFIRNDGILIICFHDAGAQLFDTRSTAFLAEEDLLFSKEDLDMIRDIREIGQDFRGNLLLLSFGEGFYLDFESGMISKINDQSKIYRSVCYSTKYGFLVGTHSGVYKVNKQAGEYKLSPFHPELFGGYAVLSLLENDEKEIWVGTENEGLMILRDQKSTKHKADSNSEKNINGNSVWTLFEDSNGIEWIGFYKRGICNTESSYDMFNYVNYFTNAKKDGFLGFVSSIIEDKDLGLVIGTEGNGLQYFGNQSSCDVQKKSVEEDWVVTDIAKTNSGELWVATWAGGLKVYDFVEKQFIDLYDINPSLRERSYNLLAVYANKQGYKFVASFRGGLLIFNEENELIEGIDQINAQLPSTEIRKIEEDCEGNILLAIDQIGVWKLTFDNQMGLKSSRPLVEEKHYNNHSGILSDIIVDERCNVWMATFGDGVFKWNRETAKVTSINEENGLQGSMIFSLQEDDSGNIWVTTNTGIDRIDASMKIDQYHTIERDGSYEFSPHAGFKDESGIIYFGSTQGYVSFDPRHSVQKDQLSLDIYFTEIKANDEYVASEEYSGKGIISSGTPFILNHDQNNVVVQFAANNILHAQHNQYSYFLEGLENDFREPTNLTSVQYSGLKPGKYVFKVKVKNQDLQWSDTSYLEIKVKSPWYLCYWAKLIYVLTGIFLLYSLYRFRVNTQLKQKNKQLDVANNMILKIQESEMSSLASIVHEGLGQDVVALKQYLKMKDVHVADELIEKLIQDVRIMALNLNPRLLKEYTFGEACLKLVKNYRDASFDDLIMIDESMETLLNYEQKVQIYYIIRSYLNLTLASPKIRELNVQLTTLTEKMETILLRFFHTDHIPKDTLVADRRIMQLRAKSIHGVERNYVDSLGRSITEFSFPATQETLANQEKKQKVFSLTNRFLNL